MSETSEACRSCGAALAEDQRYCLNCGERHGGPRVEFRQHLEAREERKPAASPADAGESAGDGKGRQRDYAPLAAVAGIAVLGVMLLIGVLIGRGTDSSGTSSAPPRVITVGAADSGAGASGGGGADAAQKQQGGNGGGKAKSARKAKASAGRSPDTGDAPVVSEDQLKKLQAQSPDEYSESSAKLPDEIATPGEAPAPDGKAPGGGSGGTTIE